MKPMYKIRLLPVLVLTAVLTLGTKVETIVTGAGKIDISPALAEPKTDKVNSDRAADEGKATADQATNAQNESSEAPSVKTAGPKYAVSRELRSRCCKASRSDVRRWKDRPVRSPCGMAS